MSREKQRQLGAAVAVALAAAALTIAAAAASAQQPAREPARRNAENQRRTLDVTLQRLEGGRGTELDTERARAQLSATLADVPTLEAAAAAARYRIGVLTAREPQALALDTLASLGAGVGEAYTPLALPAAVAPGGDDALRALVRRRPDVRSAEEQLAARSAFVGAARAEYLPRLGVGGATGDTSAALGALGNTGRPRYAVGPVISWPALDLGRVRAGVNAARAEEEAARARYDGAVLRAVGEVETTRVAYEKARERLGHLDAAAAASERAAELARLRFTEGASDFLPVLDAERTLLEAQDRRAAGRAAAAARLVAYYRALGGAWPGADVAR